MVLKTLQYMLYFIMGWFLADVAATDETSIAVLLVVFVCLLGILDYQVEVLYKTHSDGKL